ncbi:MAG: hypothetical protein PHI68_00375 [Candidatus Cloacimonetes bacterium]|nr:hypothetical protein [Candidatus Cloacimonadota bacterium]
MLAQQKEALATLISSIVFFLLLLLLPVFVHSMISEAVMLLLLFFISSLWIARRKYGIKYSKLDEMDRTIRLQAAMIATHALGATVFIYALALYLIHRHNLAVPCHQILLLAMHSWLALYGVWSAFILILYKRGVFRV